MNYAQLPRLTPEKAEEQLNDLRLTAEGEDLSKLSPETKRERLGDLGEIIFGYWCVVMQQWNNVIHVAKHDKYAPIDFLVEYSETMQVKIQPLFITKNSFSINHQPASELKHARQADLVIFIEIPLQGPIFNLYGWNSRLPSTQGFRGVSTPIELFNKTDLVFLGTFDDPLLAARARNLSRTKG